MTRHSHRHLFLDTNVLIHYVAFEIDWLSLADADEVTLVVAPVVIAELDKLKEAGRHRRLRDRASTVIRRLAEYHDSGGEIRRSTRLVLEALEPAIDFKEHVLARDIPDDHLIASILAFRAAQPDAQVALVSAELKFKVKCRHHGIEVLAPPEEKKAPDVLDEHEKRVKELEAENLRLRNRIPKLDVTFDDGSRFCKLTANLTRPMTEEEIAQRTEQERQHYPYQSVPSPATEQAMAFLSVASSGFERGQYNEKVRGYLQKYEEYLRKLSRYQAQALPTTLLRITMSNTGTAPAEDVDLEISVESESGVLFAREESLPVPPKAPAPPPPFDHFAASRWGALGGLSNLENFHLPQMTSLVDVLEQSRPPDLTGPAITNDDTGTVAEYWIRKLKQHMSTKLPKVIIVFDGEGDEVGFKIECRIKCDSIPEVQESSLDVKLRVARG